MTSLLFVPPPNSRMFCPSLTPKEFRRGSSIQRVNGYEDGYKERTVRLAISYCKKVEI